MARRLRGRGADALDVAQGDQPDNARMEGFFGRLKNELLHGRDWEGVPLADAAAMIDAWMARYSLERLKMFRGADGKARYDTIDGRRRCLGLAA